MFFILFSKVTKVVVACSATWNVLFSVGLQMMAEPAYNSEIGRVPSQAVMLERIRKDTGLFFPTNSVVLHMVERETFIDPEWVAEVEIPVFSYDPFIRSLTSYSIDDPMVDMSFPESMSWWKLDGIAFKYSYTRPYGPFVKVFVSSCTTNVYLFINCSY